MDLERDQEEAIIRDERLEQERIAQAEETQRKLTNYFRRKLAEMQVNPYHTELLIKRGWMAKDLIGTGKVQTTNRQETINLCNRYMDKMTEVMGY